MLPVELGGRNINTKLVGKRDNQLDRLEGIENIQVIQLEIEVLADLGCFGDPGQNVEDPLGS